MQYFKRKTKLSILTFLIIVLSITISISTLAKTEVYFSLYDNPFLLTGSYNWTASANNRNDENLMIIDDPGIIQIFQNQFVNLWTNKYNSERTKELFSNAKVNILTVFPPVQTGTKVININSASLEELASILQISEPLARKIIALREELEGFKDLQARPQLPELTNLDWKEWIQEGIVINVQ